MIERGFIPEFPKEVLQELERMQKPAEPQASYRDLRHLLWVSIDNDDSRDLDQLTVGEVDKLYVAIADVDGLVKIDSQIDRYANHNTTSVYTPTKVFPMLPHKLSTNLTSLNPDTDRCAIVVEMNIDSEGRFSLADLYLALVRNQAKLAYNGVAAWIEKDQPLPVPNAILDQLKLQDELAQRIRSFRMKQGALGFDVAEGQVVVVNGEVVAVKQRVINRAHQLIENAMIAANVGVTRYLVEWNLPTLRRVVHTPKRWARIQHLAHALGEQLPGKPNVVALSELLTKLQKNNPEHFPDFCLSVIKLIGRGEYVVGVPGKMTPGHFDLALRDYSHTTAPNRRYPDLIMQRLVKSHLLGQSVPYRYGELMKIAMHCTEKEDAAAKVERRLYKCAAAMLLVKEIGQQFEAIVTGASLKGTWVRLMTLPVEGRLTHGHEELDVGDRICVQLIRVDIHNGHIDFRACR